jgi:hypothetical protein
VVKGNVGGSPARTVGFTGQGQAQPLHWNPSNEPQSRIKLLSCASTEKFMSEHSRRKFIVNTGKAALITGLASLTNTTASAMTANNIFVHHVYFWLKNPESKPDFDKLVEGLRKLSKVKTIKMFHIGKPANTNREVIDRSYSVSWMLHFNNLADQEVYQTDPIHLKFIEECSSLWSKVVVYDSVDV